MSDPSPPQSLPLPKPTSRFCAQRTVGRPGQAPEEGGEGLVLEQGLPLGLAPRAGRLAHRGAAVQVLGPGGGGDAGRLGPAPAGPGRGRPQAVDAAGPVGALGRHEAAQRVPGDALDKVAVLRELRQQRAAPLALLHAPHDGRVVDGPRDQRRPIRGPAQVHDIVRVAAQHGHAAHERGPAPLAGLLAKGRSRCCGVVGLAGLPEEHLAAIPAGNELVTCTSMGGMMWNAGAKLSAPTPTRAHTPSLQQIKDNGLLKHT